MRPPLRLPLLSAGIPGRGRPRLALLHQLLRMRLQHHLAGEIMLRRLLLHGHSREAAADVETSGKSPQGGGHLRQLVRQARDRDRRGRAGGVQSVEGVRRSVDGGAVPRVLGGFDVARAAPQPRELGADVEDSETAGGDLRRAGEGYISRCVETGETCERRGAGPSPPASAGRGMG